MAAITENEINKSNINSTTMTISTNSSQNQTKFEIKQSLNIWPTFLCTIIFGIQFLERLSFYFLKSTLPEHLIDNLGINNLIANSSQKLFIQITFFAAIVGGIFCDLKYGRYKILIQFFIIYLIGQILITISPFIPGFGFLHPYFDFFAIFLLAYGCGCIKAVLIAYGADQFKQVNIKQIGYFFALFYSQEQIAIIFEIYLFPLIKSFNIWPLSINNKLNILLLTTFLLFLSTVILFSTFNNFYQWIPQNNNNIFIKSFNIIKQSLYNKWRRKPLITTTKKELKPKYFLEYFLINHNCQRDKECDFGRNNICGQAKFISELKTIFEICLVLLPLSFFWAIRTKILSFNILQIQNINNLQFPFIGQLSFLSIDKLCYLLQPFFILLLLPLFYIFIFQSPSFSKYLSLNTYLRRICIGIFLSFITCFFIANNQKLLNNSSSFIKSTEDFNFVKLFNIFPSKCSFSISRINSQNDYIIISANNSKIFSLKSEDLNIGYIDLLFRFNGSLCLNHKRNIIRISLNSSLNNKFNIALIGPQGIFWTSIDVNNNNGQQQQLLLSSSIGFLILLPCNSILSTTISSPFECSSSNNLTNNILTQSLTPLSQSLTLCDDFGNCPINWNSNEVLFSTFFVFPPSGDNLGKGKGSIYSIKNIPLGKYQIFSSSSQLQQNELINNNLTNISQNITMTINEDGSIWIAVLSLDGSPLAGQNDSLKHSNPTFSLLQLSGPSQLGIIWLFPQNILMAASDILISVSGLEFCYIQSPSFLKATMLGYWYLIIYIGYSFIPIISKIQPFTDSFFQLLFCSFLLFNISLIFAIISYFYYNYQNNSFNGSFIIENEQLNEQINNKKLTEKISGTLKANLVRLPTKKVIRL